MKTSPIVLGLTSAAMFGAATPISKALLNDFSAPQLAGLLYLGAALGVLPFSFRGAGRRPTALPAKGWRYLAAAVLFGGILGPLLLLAGLAITPAGDASLILNLELAATALLGFLFFREQLNRSGFIAVVGITFSGAIISYNTGLPGLAGGSLIAVACICWAFDNHWTSVIDAISPAQTTLIKGLVAGLANLSLGLVLAPLSAPPATIFAALVLGAFSYGISITLYVECAQRLGPTRAQGLFATSPFIGAALSFLFLAESLSYLHFIGASVLVTCVILLLRAQHSHPHSHESLWHSHLHSHDDEHHNHCHASGFSHVEAQHSHWHRHDATTHTHPHVPDLHHRHKH